MKPIHRILAAFCLLATVSSLCADDERVVTEEQQAAIASGGDLPAAPKRPEKLPDLTKGEFITDENPQVWHLGPTGVVVTLSGGFEGDQMQVQKTLPGSPADGKFQWGDVIVGMNGRKFTSGGHICMLIGDAIVEAEKAENKGKITFQVWRDKNYAARFGRKDIAGTDIEKLINQVTSDDSLYDWKQDEERKIEVAKGDLKAFPIDPTTFEVELTLRVFPSYSDTAPYDCPKTKQILEEAWKVLEKRFVADPKVPGSGKGGVLEAIALVASGKPEHRKIVHDWVRSKNSPWGPPTTPAGAMFEPGSRESGGKHSWHHAFTGLHCAIYYDATGDDYVFPAMEKFAINASLGQSKAGTWGHAFAMPSFNGGQFNQMNPGYGGLNAAGARCFTLIALAQKLGVKHPAVDAAVKRSHRFFGSYVDQGSIPYGDHGAANVDDSNGKNAGAALAMKAIGDKYRAKYFAMTSAHASFTPRGGHAHDYFTNWSPWAASLCGPQVRAYNERNFRWRRTLCRLHDGSFVYHSPSGKYRTLHDPTATEILHQAAPLKQTVISGKDPDESLYLTERDMKQLMLSAAGQFNDPWLKEIAGKPWNERSTDELLDLLDMFLPRTRREIAKELGKRFQAGESAIVPRLVALLTHESPRYRHGAIAALDACGNDPVLSNLSGLIPLLNDPEDFVRIGAVNAVSKATDNKDVQLALLKTAVSKRTAEAPNSVRNAIQNSILGSKTVLSESPFKSQFDEALVEQALSELILEETGGGPFVDAMLKLWDKDTVVRLAGPITFIAEEEQVYDQMFGSRNTSGQAILSKFGYLEGIQTNAYRIRKRAEIPRRGRAAFGFKDPMINPDLAAKQPGVFADLTDEMRTILVDRPIEVVTIKDKSTNWLEVSTPLVKLLKAIEGAKSPAALPSIAEDVRALFQTKLDAAQGTGAKIKVCRERLANPAYLDTFYKIAAMDQLVELLGADAMEDLVPYLGHDYWRLRDHSRKVAAGLARSGAAANLVAALATATDEKVSAGILATLAMAQSKSAWEPATKAMSHASPVVRREAVKAVVAIGGDSAIPTVVNQLKQAKENADIEGWEAALDPFTNQPASAAKLRPALIALLPDVQGNARSSVHYLLARIGDAPSLAVLKKAAESKDPAECSSAVLGLSYSPNREADKILLDLAASDPKRAAIVGIHAVRRMAIGPKGFGDIPSAQAVAFADALLKYNLSGDVVAYLGMIPDPRAMNSLLFCLQKGFTKAAASLVACAEGLENLPPADAKIAATALQGVIEYMEVTHLRGGIKAHMGIDDRYTEWKALQARAGKALLKFHKPETAPIPTFDTLDLER